MYLLNVTLNYALSFPRLVAMCVILLKILMPAKYAFFLKT
jgi:hypothetical protein